MVLQLEVSFSSFYLQNKPEKENEKGLRVIQAMLEISVATDIPLKFVADPDFILSGIKKVNVNFKIVKILKTASFFTC